MVKKKRDCIVEVKTKQLWTSLPIKVLSMSQSGKHDWLSLKCGDIGGFTVLYNVGKS